MAKPKVKSVGIVLDRRENFLSTFLLRGLESHNIKVGATVRIVESKDDIVTAYEWLGTVAEIVEPKKKTGLTFKDKVAVLEVTCKAGDAANAKKKDKADLPKRDLGDPGDIIVIEVTITNPGGEVSDLLLDVAGLIP